MGIIEKYIKEREAVILAENSNKPEDLPQQDGFRFFAIMEDGSEIRDVVHFTGGEYWSVCGSKMIAWKPRT